MLEEMFKQPTVDELQLKELKKNTAANELQHQELKKVSAATQNLAHAQRAVEVQQARIVELNKQSLALQEEANDIGKAQLALQKQQLVAQELATVQLQMQTQLLQLEHLRTAQQRAFKEAAHSLRDRLGRVDPEWSPLVRAVLFTALIRARFAAGLTPSALEEIGDKQFVSELVAEQSAALEEAKSRLTDEQLKILVHYETGQPDTSELVEAEATLSSLQATIHELRCGLSESPVFKASFAEAIMYGVGIQGSSTCAFYWMGLKPLEAAAIFGLCMSVPSTVMIYVGSKSREKKSIARQAELQARLKTPQRELAETSELVERLREQSTAQFLEWEAFLERHGLQVLPSLD
jgi:hypothetical protein